MPPGFAPAVLPDWYARRYWAAQAAATRKEAELDTHGAKRLLWACLKALKPQFAVDADNAEVLRGVSQWLARDRSEGVDDGKGLCLVGGVGTGKTLLLRAVSASLREMSSPRAFEIAGCEAVVREYEEEGRMGWRFKTGARAFDDLGDERRELVLMGNRIEPMLDVVMSRHRLWERDGTATHFTTNLCREEIAARYGSRATDRIGQMCNVFTLGGASRR